MKLISYRKNIYSQNGEDGIIEEILNRLNIKEGSFVEFGALDGVTFSNTYNLLKNKNWQGFYIESDKKNYFHLEKLKEIYKEKLIILNEKVEVEGESSLDKLIKKHTNFSKQFDLLSIDIDSFDYQIFENLQEYKPTIIIIEIESTIHPPKEQIHDGIKNFRTSFSSMVKLGQTKGYTAVCHTGNIIFVRNDKLNQIKLEEEYIQNPNQLFLSKGWYFQNPGTVQTISWKEEFKKSIFSFNIENNLDFYKKENFQNQLSICKFFDNYKSNEKFNLHFYWQDYGTPFNEKHALSIKSAITTQNLNICKIILWSNKDLSENEYLKPLLPFIQHKIWDMEKHLKDFGLEKLIEPLKLDRGYLTSDIFRILCMGLYGGIYCDLDVILLKDFSSLLNYEFTYFWPLKNSQNNAIMRIDYQSDFFKKIIETIKNIEKINPNSYSLGEELYNKIRQNFKDYSIFPMSWFDGDWLNVDFKDNFKSNKKQLFYDDAFAWHWHNNWNEPIEKDSKFFIYQKRIQELFIKKFKYLPIEQEQGNISLEKIFDLYGSDKGTVLEGHRYGEGYQKILNKNMKNLLEIGIGSDNGSCASVMSWFHWLPEIIIYAFDRVGIDNVKPHVKAKLKNNSNFKLILGDQGKIDDIFLLRQTIPDCDLIIDDGSHINSHQIYTFYMLWDKVKKGGYYVIEDVHCKFGGPPNTVDVLLKHPNFYGFMGKINEGVIFKK